MRVLRSVTGGVRLLTFYLLVLFRRRLVILPRILKVFLVRLPLRWIPARGRVITWRRRLLMVVRRARRRPLLRNRLCVRVTCARLRRVPWRLLLVTWRRLRFTYGVGLCPLQRRGCRVSRVCLLLLLLWLLLRCLLLFVVCIRVLTMRRGWR